MPSLPHLPCAVDLEQAGSSGGKGDEEHLGAGPLGSQRTGGASGEAGREERPQFSHPHSLLRVSSVSPGPPN